MVDFKLQIVTCDHFSSLCHGGLDDKRIVKMQEALQKSQCGILKGRDVNYLVQNYNLETLAIQVHDVAKTMLRFLGAMKKRT